MSKCKCFPVFRGRRRSKPPDKEDRLSALPDSLIHRILSFLPSTKDAIRTSVLSKQWRNQWTNVSNLIFDFSGMSSNYPPGNILDHTLSFHVFPKIQKFQIISDRVYECSNDFNFEEKILFVVGKQVEELILNFSLLWKFRFPKSFYFQPSLVKLQLSGCTIMPTEMVNWGSLKDLSIENCRCTCEVLKSIVSGSPMLQSLELNYHCYCFSRLVIASKSLKRLVVNGRGCEIDIWCPNLVEFYGDESRFRWCEKVLEKFLSDSPLLEVLELKNFFFQNLRIASTTLKRFVFSMSIKNEIQISCPHLKELALTGSIRKIRLMNLPSLVCASLNLVCNKELDGPAAKKILEQFQHLNELKLGKHFVESLAALEEDGMWLQLLNCKSLTLEDSDFYPTYVRTSGIAYALRSSPVLERLVVKLQPEKYQSPDGLLYWGDPKEDYWSSNEACFSKFVSRLTTVEIIGFSHWECKRKAVLDFAEFLLKNATALEKMVVILEDCETDFVIAVSRKLLSFPRCSKAKIELLWSK